jgi:hypothetical protein
VTHSLPRGRGTSCAYKAVIAMPAPAPIGTGIITRDATGAPIGKGGELAAVIMRLLRAMAA